jgi:hypothetical protein
MPLRLGGVDRERFVDVTLQDKPGGVKAAADDTGSALTIINANIR